MNAKQFGFLMELVRLKGDRKKLDYVSNVHLSRHTNTSLNTLKRYLRELKEIGIIKVSHDEVGEYIHIRITKGQEDRIKKVLSYGLDKKVLNVILYHLYPLEGDYRVLKLNGELEEKSNLNYVTISTHMKELKKLGIIKTELVGKVKYDPTRRISYYESQTKITLLKKPLE